MKLLLDESVPVQISRAFQGQEVHSVKGIGWSGFGNGDFLAAAEKENFDDLIVADKNLRYQQNLSVRRLAILELWTNHRPTLERHLPMISEAVERLAPSKYLILDNPEHSSAARDPF